MIISPTHEAPTLLQVGATQKAENANAAAARMVAKKKARRGCLPRPARLLTENRTESLYGNVTPERLAVRNTPALGSPQEVNSRLLSLFREREVIQKAIDALLSL